MDKKKDKKDKNCWSKKKKKVILVQAVVSNRWFDILNKNAEIPEIWLVTVSPSSDMSKQYTYA